MNPSVGIDHLNLYASTLNVPFASIVKAREISNKEFQNVRFTRRSILPSYEDPVTMAANAAKPLVAEYGPDAFGLLILATETGVDAAKPISTFVHKYLGLSKACCNFEIKHACYAGTASLKMAAAWASANPTRGKFALVIMTDVGRKHFGESAELSVGAGAIAMVVGVEPRIFELDPWSGPASAEVYDTARPTMTSEWINPALSIGAYLDLLEIAWGEYCAARQASAFEQNFDYMIYHTPLLSLIEAAHAVLLSSEREVTADEVRQSFLRMVDPSLVYNNEMGNIYSGSIYLALIGLIDTLPSQSAPVRIGCYSYGSGSCAEFFSGRILPDAARQLSQQHIAAHLAARHTVSIPEYETLILQVEKGLAAADFEPDWNAPMGLLERAYQGQGRLVLEHVQNYYRTYRWI